MEHQTFAVVGVTIKMHCIFTATIPEQVAGNCHNWCLITFTNWYVPLEISMQFIVDGRRCTLFSNIIRIHRYCLNKLSCRIFFPIRVRYINETFSLIFSNESTRIRNTRNTWTHACFNWFLWLYGSHKYRTLQWQRNALAS